MASQASSKSGVVTAAAIAASHITNLVDHAITTETAQPATIFEGKVYARTDLDQFHVGVSGAAAETLADYGAWKNYTPTVAGTVNANAVTGKYRVVAPRTIEFWAFFTLGPGGSVGAQPTLTVPFPMSNQIQYVGFRGWAICAGQTYNAAARYFGVSTIGADCLNVGGAHGFWQPCGATTPGTWANGDGWYITGTYETSTAQP